MLKYIIVLLAIAAADLYSRDVGGLAVGWCGYTGRTTEFDPLPNSGIYISMLDHVNVKWVDVMLKIKFSYFGSRKDENIIEQNIYFAGLANELLFGKRVALSRKTSVIPQLGLGLRGEARYMDLNVGGYSLDGFCDYSLQIERAFGRVGIGLIVNYEMDFNGADKSFKTGRRLNSGIIISF